MGRKYNVEYEGLHLLCTNCGKFGHYAEGCPDKNKPLAISNNSLSAEGSSRNMMVGDRLGEVMNMLRRNT